MFLGALGLLIGTLCTVLTIYRCRQRWQFLCIAIWKATLSVSLGALGVSAARETRRLEKAWALSLEKTQGWVESGGDIDELDMESYIPRYTSFLWWLSLYAAAIPVGLTGLISLVKLSWGEPTVVTASKVFGGLTITITGIMFLHATWQSWRKDQQKWDIMELLGLKHHRISDDMQKWLSWFGGGLIVSCAVLLVLCGLLAALYSDWVLAGLAGSLIGAPSSDNSALYFVYFAAKRLPFFSI
jgi:hypothetical protein